MSTEKKESPLFRTWRKRHAAYQKGEPIKESLIVAIRSALSGSKKGTLTPSEQKRLKRWFTDVAFNITPEQTEKGLKWLRRMRKRLPPQDAQVIDNFDHFLFEGVVPYERQLLPLYRVVAKDGTWFSYTPSPWQANPGSVFAIYLRSTPREVTAA